MFSQYQTAVEGTGFVSRYNGNPNLVASWEYGKGAQTQKVTTGNLVGTITTNGTTTVTGSSTTFTTTFTLGDLIVIPSDGSYQVTAVASDTSLTVAIATANGGAGLTYRRTQTLLSYLPDVSGNGWHMAQYYLQYQPVWIDGKGIICSTNRWLECLSAAGILNNATGWTVVFKGTPGTGASDKTILAINQSSGLGKHRLRMSVAGTSSNKLRFNCYPSGSGTTDVSRIGTASVTTGTTQTLTTTFDCATDTTKHYIGATLDSTLTTPATTTSSIPNANPLTIHLGADGTLTNGIPAGFFSNGNSSNVGYIQEVHLFNVALSAGQVLT